ncbi:hypothetical protein GCM10011571_29420 [Marinithermofilum abyssi]|uniref:WYL domain-containing protein n=1 Tax=Marinithermofilum abyssi TaxID=1571185 RepID=A0A8J2YEK4_9BACL|nr:hypothetical protein [Marinithermofilum abyssi]GGE25360.1 hypothetical protein GCM10011571_29420 [Marinithermofilum abyssi]
MDWVLTHGSASGFPIDMIYLDEQGNCTQRRVRICSVEKDYILGFCYERRAFRRFKRSGILAAMKGEGHRGPRQ